MTDDALHRAFNASGSQRRTRQRVGTARSELRNLGLVVDTGRRGRSDCCGLKAVLWGLPDAAE